MPTTYHILTTSRRNRNMLHALTTYPTNPKFGTVITNKLSQKATPQVRRPVVITVPVHVNKIHVRSNKNHPKGITNSLFKLPKFQTKSTPTQTGPHPKPMANQVKSTPDPIFPQGTGPQTSRN